MGRILGIDYGDSRIGLAASDPLCITAQPLKVLTVRNGWKNTVPEIHKIVNDMNIDRIIVGYPLNKNGTRGTRCEVTDRFIEVLAAYLGNVEISRWDERYTTKQAVSSLGKKNKTKGINDVLSAVLILQSYLDFSGNNK